MNEKKSKHLCTELFCKHLVYCLHTDLHRVSHTGRQDHTFSARTPEVIKGNTLLTLPYYMHYIILYERERATCLI